MPSNQSNYIGTWQNTGSDAEYTLTIKENGTAEYDEVHSASNKTISGYIFFDGYNFEIGTKLIHKKFKANQPPRKVIVTLNPYVYYWVATFNGIDYRR